MSQIENPCMICAVDQKCCKDMGLKLSRGEYEKHFKRHSDRFSVIKYGKMFIVFPGDDRPCPYLTEDGCSIYEDRPVDCRLYPFELYKMVEKNAEIEVILYDQTDCPHKEDLFIPIEDAKQLMVGLARDVFGLAKPVHFKYEPGKKPRRAFGPLNPLISKISHLLRSQR